MECLQETTVACPYCGEHISVLLDLSVSQQTYVEDCQVCCCPIVFDVQADYDDRVTVQVSREDE